MKPILFEFNSPHFLQTAYQRGVSYDAIFATQEAALKVLREGGKAFISLFDLEKAFDTIEKAVLFSRSASDNIRTVIEKTESVYVQKFQRSINGTLFSGEFSKSLTSEQEAVGAYFASSFIDQ